jgi:hypothetical protein
LSRGKSERNFMLENRLKRGANVEITDPRVEGIAIGLASIKDNRHLAAVQQITREPRDR